MTNNENKELFKAAAQEAEELHGLSLAEIMSNPDKYERFDEPSPNAMMCAAAELVEDEPLENSGPHEDTPRDYHPDEPNGHLPPFDAIKQAIKDVWGPEVLEFENRDILEGCEEWLTPGPDLAIASICSGYSLAPAEPFSMVDHTAFGKWEKVQEAASEYIGRKVYFDSINCEVFRFYWAG